MTDPSVYYPQGYTAVLDGNDILNLRGVNILAAFLSDNTLRLTTNFKTTAAAGGPGYSSVDLAALGLGGTLSDFTVDASSPLYTGGGLAVNGWVCTTTQVRRITDIFGSVALGTAFTFAYASPRTVTGNDYGGRTMNFERGVQNWGIVSSWCGDQGTYAAYTTDGENWTENQITTHYSYMSSAPNSGLGIPPGIFISPHTAGLAYISAFSASDTSYPWTTQTTALYKTDDYGANFALDATYDPGQAPSASIAVAYQDTARSFLYYGKHAWTTNMQPALMRNSADISPTSGGYTYGPRQHGRAIALSDGNQDLLVLCGGTLYSTTGLSKTFLTTNARSAVPGWSELSMPSGKSAIGSYPVDASQMYFIGTNGFLGYYDGSTIDDRTGNISSSGRVVGICGGG